MMETDEIPEPRGSGETPDSQRIQSHYKCHRCDYQASTKWNLSLHLKNWKPDTSLHQCSECSFRACFKPTLALHVGKFHRGKTSRVSTRPVRKPQKQKEEIDLQNLNLENETNTPQNRKYKCNRCSYTASSSSNLRIHQKRPQYPVLCCPHCDFTSCFSHSFHMHMKEFHSSSSLNTPRLQNNTDVEHDSVDDSESSSSQEDGNQRGEKKSVESVPRIKFSFSKLSRQSGPESQSSESNNFNRGEDEKHTEHYGNQSLRSNSLTFVERSIPRRQNENDTLEVKPSKLGSLANNTEFDISSAEKTIHSESFVNSSKKMNRNCDKCCYVAKTTQNYIYHTHTERRPDEPVLKCSACDYTAYFVRGLQLHTEQFHPELLVREQSQKSRRSTSSKPSKRTNYSLTSNGEYSSLLEGSESSLNNANSQYLPLVNQRSNAQKQLSFVASKVPLGNYLSISLEPGDSKLIQMSQDSSWVTSGAATPEMDAENSSISNISSFNMQDSSSLILPDDPGILENNESMSLEIYGSLSCSPEPEMIIPDIIHEFKKSEKDRNIGTSQVHVSTFDFKTKAVQNFFQPSSAQFSADEAFLEYSATTSLKNAETVTSVNSEAISFAETKVLSNENTNPIEFKCDRCSFTAQKIINFRRHLTARRNYSVLECPDCHYKACFPSTLKSHMMTAHQEGKLPKSFNFKENEYNCERCSYTSTTQTNLDAHVAAKNSQPVFQCPECDYTACFSIGFTRHMNRVHPCSQAVVEVKPHKLNLTYTGNSYKFNCNRCSYGSDIYEALNVHNSKRTKDPVLQCPYCTYTACFSNGLGRHVTKAHRSTPAVSVDDTVMVILENKNGRTRPSTKRRSSFKSPHAMKLAQLPLWSCTKCSYTTNSTVSLNAHTFRSNRDDPVYNCPLCSYTACFPMGIHKHRKQSHPTEPPINFPQLFTTPTSLRVVGQVVAVREVSKLSGIPMATSRDLKINDLTVQQQITPVLAIQEPTPQHYDLTNQVLTPQHSYLRKINKASILEHSPTQNLRTEENHGMTSSFINQGPKPLHLTATALKDSILLDSTVPVSTLPGSTENRSTTQNLMQRDSTLDHPIEQAASNPTMPHNRAGQVRTLEQVTLPAEELTPENSMTAHGREHPTDEVMAIKITKNQAPAFKVTTAEERTSDNMYKCKLCNYSAKCRSFVNIHERIHRDEKPFQCSLCLKPFAGQGAVIAHMKNNCPKNKKVLSEEPAPALFAKKVLTNHPNTADQGTGMEHGDSKLRRRLRNAVKINISSGNHAELPKILKKPVPSSMGSENSGSINYSCPYCDFTTVFRRMMFIHVKSHPLSSINFPCTYCPYTSHYLHVIEKHESEHKRFTHECSQCEKLFMSEENLKRHELIHKKANVYKNPINGGEEARTETEIF